MIRLHDRIRLTQDEQYFLTEALCMGIEPDPRTVEELRYCLNLIATGLGNSPEDQLFRAMLKPYCEFAGLQEVPHAKV